MSLTGSVGTGVLFLAPLRLEARAVRHGAPGAEIEVIGMGPGRATAARARIAARETAGRPLILAGVAGGLDSDLLAGDVLVASSIGSTESDESVELENAPAIAALLEAAGLRVVLGKLCSSPVIVSGAEPRAELARRGAMAVDMEARWCAPLARRHPFAVVRAILDVPGRELRSLSTPRAARKAYRSLMVVAGALSNWSPLFSIEQSLEEVGEL